MSLNADITMDSTGIDIDVKINHIRPLEEPTNSLTADFSADDTTPVTGQTVSFTDESTGSPTAWFWDFGDGKYSTLQNPTHTYNVSGSYTVTLFVYKDGVIADVETKTNYIVVTGNATNIAYRRPKLTGQTTSYADYDDGWRLANGIYNYQSNYASGIIPLYQGEDPIVRDGTINDWLKLSPLTPNAFGNLFVWTDSAGGQTFVNGGYIINHITGQGWVRRSGSGGTPTGASGAGQTVDSTTWANAITAIEASTLHGFTDWYLPNIYEYSSIAINNSTIGSLTINYTPMQIGVNWFFWTGTTVPGNTANAYQARINANFLSASEAKTVARNYLMVRNHYT